MVGSIQRLLRPSIWLAIWVTPNYSFGQNNHQPSCQDGQDIFVGPIHYPYSTGLQLTNSIQYTDTVGSRAQSHMLKSE
jgi:hypothetical protein